MEESKAGYANMQGFKDVTEKSTAQLQIYQEPKLTCQAIRALIRGAAMVTLEEQQVCPTQVGESVDKTSVSRKSLAASYTGQSVIIIENHPSWDMVVAVGGCGREPGEN